MLLLGPNSNSGDAINLGAVVPRINVPIPLTANRTMTAADSGMQFVYNGGSGASITITFPSTLPDGFSCRISNAGQGTVAFNLSGMTHFGNAGRSGLIFQWDVCDVNLYTDSGFKIANTIYNLALPVLYAENTAAETRNVTALSALAGLTIPMEAGGAYDVRILIPYTCGVTTNALRVGTLAWPAGATGALEVAIYNAQAAGTAPKTNHYWPTSALAVTGTPGTASVVGQTMLASIQGRIKLSTTAGNLAITVGALTTTGAVSIASGAASFSASKVFDLGRT